MNANHEPVELPQERYVVLLLRAARRLEAEGERFFYKQGLTLAQFNLLNLVGGRGEMRQFDLARELVVGKATVSSVMGGLLKRRLIRLAPDAEDRRANVVSLTATGIVLWTKARKAYLAELENSLPNVSAKELRALDTGLEPVKGLATDMFGGPVGPEGSTR